MDDSDYSETIGSDSDEDIEEEMNLARKEVEKLVKKKSVGAKAQQEAKPNPKKTERKNGRTEKAGRPPKRAKYEFNVRDKAVMEEAVKKHGNSYATIAKEYFADCNPPVTRTDIANFVNCNPHLKEFCQTRMIFSL